MRKHEARRHITLTAMLCLCAAIAVQSLVGSGGSYMVGAAEDSGAGLSGNTSAVSPKYGAEIPSWALKASNEYTFDFTEDDVKYYARHDALELLVRTGFEVANGHLTCAKDNRYVIASSGYLGDDYGIKGGTLGFTMLQSGGTLDISMRVITETLRRTDKGLWFTFENKTLTIEDKMTRTKATIDISPYVKDNEPVAYEFSDNVTEITLSIDGTQVARVVYDEGAYSVSNYEATVTFYGTGDEVLAVSEESTLQRAGHFLMSASNLEGYVDSLHFTRNDIDFALPESNSERAIDYSTWVATDDLDRVTSLYDTTGAPKEDKSIGVFYFLCWIGAAGTVQDNTKLYLELGVDGFKSFLEERGGEAYWAEPYFGYYRNTDTWVYRKHAYMLEAAGVDFIFLDISNAEVFVNGHMALFDTWLQIRREGGSTPQICFLTGDTPSTFEKDVSVLRTTVYAEKNWDKYKELFYMWEGKPLIFGNQTGISTELQTYLDENFTVRGCWAWCDKDGYWNWLDETTQDKTTGEWSLKKGRDLNGNFEQLSVALGHHASSSKGRSFVNASQPSDGLHDFEFSLDTSRYGYGFASQAEHALAVSPRVVMITGWNEWIAGNGRDASHIANTPINNVCYVDQFNPEFSRDAEPMKMRDGVGFGDNFYYQMVDFIRKYKGTEQLTIAQGQATQDMMSGADAWNDITPEYRDTIGDAEFRNTICYDASFRYLNGSGRNDFDYAKVTQDADNVYFMVKTVNDIVRGDDAQWLNLFIDTDMKNESGWEGYDYVINRSRSDETVSVERFVDGSWSGEKVADAKYTVSGNVMVVQVSKRDLGYESATTVNFDFKWADNSTEVGEIMEFMDLGDTAPNDRFNFRYVSDPVAYEKAIKSADEGLPSWIWIVIGATAVVVIGAAVVLIISKKKTS